MNKRDYKQTSAGSFVHAYNRGNNKERIFHDDQDYRAFLLRLGLCLGYTTEEMSNEKLTSMPYSRVRIADLGRNNFRLHAFCLMPNHFHLLIEQVGDIPISKLISKLCTSYAKYFNKKYKRIGHIFQDCFKATLVTDNSEFMWVSSYIHMNPVKDKIVRKPTEYPWSSYNYFLEKNAQFLHTDFLIEIFGNKENFKKETMRFNVKESL